MDNSSGSMTANMIPWLHFGDGDYLIFKAWHPSSRGAIAGACVGLFLFCILERCLAAYRRNRELRWRAKPVGHPLPVLATSDVTTRSDGGKRDSVEASGEGSVETRRQLVPPFTPTHDIPRGAIHAVQSTFSYALMLAVMTFNGAYILSIILGLGVGEVLFGRIGHKQEE